jgi:hypothetical protein
MGVANEIVLINNTLNNDGVSEASAQHVCREGESARPIRTYWRAKERPQGFHPMYAGLVPGGPEILYIPNASDLKETPINIDLREQNGFKSYWEFSPEHQGGVLCVILVLPPGKAADFIFSPHLAKIASGRLAVYYKPDKSTKWPAAVPIAWTLREPHGSLEDEERRINKSRLWRRFVGRLRTIETERLIVGTADTAKNVATLISAAIAVILVVLALLQGTPARDLLNYLLHRERVPDLNQLMRD